jgi:hypothetical protein
MNNSLTKNDKKIEILEKKIDDFKKIKNKKKRKTKKLKKKKIIKKIKIQLIHFLCLQHYQK